MKRRGSVLMEFIMVAPLMIILISMLLQFSQIWIAREITAYAAYCACRSVLSAGSSDEAELGAQRAAELACAWMCLAGMPDSIGKSSSVSSESRELPKFHDREDVPSTETVYFDDGDGVKGEIEIPGWGWIPGSDSAGDDSRNGIRVKTEVKSIGGQMDPLSGIVKSYALVKVSFKFPLLLPLAGRMISWFVSPEATEDQNGMGRAGTVDYGSHRLTEGNNPAWNGEETVMDEDGNLVDRSGVTWGTDGRFPAIELTEYCMLPMPHSVRDRFNGNDYYSENLPKKGASL